MTDQGPPLSVGSVLVMRNAEAFLGEQLQSILAQTTALSRLVVIDDASDDRSIEIARQVLADAPFSWTVEPAQPPRRPVNLFHRIAANFVHGVRLVGTDIVLLSDHDDRWLPGRVALQSAALAAHPEIAMVSHDADLMDEQSRTVPGSLRGRFCVPDDWSARDTSSQSRYLLHNPLVTGAASAIAPARLAETDVPAGWLHDTWWALMAVSHGALLLAPDKVTTYRVHDAQALGVTDEQLHDSVGLRIRKRLDETRLGLRSQGWGSPLLFPRSAILKRTRS